MFENLYLYFLYFAEYYQYFCISACILELEKASWQSIGEKKKYNLTFLHINGMSYFWYDWDHYKSYLLRQDNTIPYMTFSKKYVYLQIKQTM